MMRRSRTQLRAGGPFVSTLWIARQQAYKVVLSSRCGHLVGYSDNLVEPALQPHRSRAAALYIRCGWFVDRALLPLGL
jgi:hypothetical protein